MQYIVKQPSITCDAGTRKVPSSLTGSEWQLLLDAVGAYSHNIRYRRLLDKLNTAEISDETCGR